MRPRIGLTMYREAARWGAWTNRHADLLPVAYTEAVRDAGGVPLLLPPGGSEEEAHTALDGVHGLLLAGGADVEPSRYGATPHPQTGPVHPERDAWELALVDAALARDVPVLAICRGAQLLNVARGGTLIQYLPDVVGHTAHRADLGVHGRETVDVQPHTRLAELIGPRIEVAAYHRQAVDRLGRGLVVSGRAGDGTVEAIELPGAAWVVGVQWHPEIAGSGHLFDGFVAACRSSVAIA